MKTIHCADYNYHLLSQGLLPGAPKIHSTSATLATFEATGLECVRGRRLFHDLHFRLEAGSMLQVRGHNGAGKTSLLRLLCGLSLPESGEIRCNGAPILRNRADYYRTLAYLGHDTALNGELTPPENLNAVRALCARRADLSVDQALHQLELDDCAHLPCGVLSTGQRQRVALAGILLRPGGIWILDEPASALDQAALRCLQQMLGAQVANGGMVIFTSHRELTRHGVRPQELNLEWFA